MDDARFCDVGIAERVASLVLIQFAADELEALQHGGLAGRAGAGEGVEHNTAGWRHQPAQVAHEVGRLHRLRGVRVRDTHPILLSEVLLQLRRQLVELLLR